MKTVTRFFFILTLGTCFLFSHTAAAAETETEHAAGFSVMKVDPTTPQVDAHSSFYDLLVQPGDTLTLQAQITNSSAEASTYDIHAVTAFTNANGEINYSREPKGTEADTSLKVPFSSIASLGEASPVSVAAGASQLVTMTISVPQDADDGVILGSWYFEKEVKEQEKETQHKGIQIDNRFAYALAVKLTVVKEIAEPHLNLLAVTPDLNNYRKVMNAQIQNDQPAVTSQLSLQGEVTKKGSDRVLYTSQQTDRIMAPNSNFNFPIFLKEDQLAAGEYTLHLTATTKDTKWEAKTWSWDKDFTVKSKEASKLNKQAINDPKPKKDVLLYILLAIIIVLLLVVLWLFVKRKKEAKK